jgi:hypothetical protein
MCCAGEASIVNETTRTEYRVVGGRGPTIYYREGDLERARALVANTKGGHIQSRTVTETPWADLPESK